MDNEPVKITPEQLDLLRKNMLANNTLDLLPGIKLIYDPEKYTIENNFSLGDFSEGADIKIHLDVRMVNVITKEQSEVKGIVIMRTK